MNELRKQLDLYEILYKSTVIQGKNDVEVNVAKNHLKTISCIRKCLVSSPDLLRALIHPESAVTGNGPELKKTFSKRVEGNPSQLTAVKKALAMKNLLVIQGPPGTGKTTVIEEIIRQIHARDSKARFIISSRNHLAVDNVFGSLKDLSSDSFKMLRIKDTAEGEIKDRYSIRKLIEASITENNKEYISKLVDEDKFSESRLVPYLYGSVSLLGVTANAILGSKFSYSEPFDYAIVDEVCQESTAELLPIFLFSKKVILIGDPKQLPACLGNYDESCGLARTEFEHLSKNPYINYLFENIHPSSKVFLDKQFRMENSIGGVVSELFYDGKLKNGKDLRLDDSLCYINYHVSPDKRTHNTNDIEYMIAKSVLSNPDLVPPGKSVIIMSPYRLQCNQGKKWNMEVDTVDRYQGKEAHIVIYMATANDFVTSFQADVRRINVAISRAKERFIIIANYGTISKIRSWKLFLKHDVSRFFYENGKIKREPSK